MTTALYNTEILRLAASLGDQPRLVDPDVSVERRSPICGSRVVVDLMVDSARITAFGQDVRSCALGQASALLLGRHVVGQSERDMREAASALKAYLSGERDDPGDWPGLDLFASARAHRARHQAILLPFEAVADAVAKACERA